MRRAAVRVLHVYKTYFPDPPGGLQEAIRQIALATTPFGVESSIFTLSPSPLPSVLHANEGRIIRSKRWAEVASCPIGGFDAGARFLSEAKNADLLHFHFPWPFADALLALIRPRACAIMTYHSDIVRQRRLGKFYDPVMMRTLSAMSAIVATSPGYVETSRTLAAPHVKPKVKFIPLGIDDALLRKEDTVTAHSHDADGAAPFILFIGVLRYYKGLDTLLDAAKLIPHRVVIAGTGPEEGRLRKRAKSEGLANVEFVGEVSEEAKASLLRRCVGLVLPSHLRSEAFGMVLLEASLFGKPMISCEIGTGTSFANSHLETGFVVRPGCAEELAERIDALFRDPAIAKRFGARARERYNELFSSRALGKAYSDLYAAVRASQATRD